MKILFISHLSSRSGAPLLILRLARELKRTKDVEVSFLVGSRGSLIDEFSLLGRVLSWPYGKQDIRTRIKDKLVNGVGRGGWHSRARHINNIKSHIESADVIVINTTWSIHMLQELNIEVKRVIAYIHELAVMTSIGATPRAMKWLGEISDRILVPCEFVRKFLVNDYAFEENKISILKYILPQDMRLPLKRSDGTAYFTVGACGILDWRKGYDLFILIAREIVYTNEIKDIRFLWIGADMDSTEYLIFKQDIVKCGLQDYVSVFGISGKVSEYFSKLDLFILPSREDPYPLVVQEVAQYEVPTVCFKDAGGIPEFVGDDAGICVDYLDVRAFCEAVLELKNNPESRKRMGKMAANRIKNQNNKEEIANQFLAYCSENQNRLATH